MRQTDIIKIHFRDRLYPLVMSWMLTIVGMSGTGEEGGVRDAPRLMSCGSHGAKMGIEHVYWQDLVS